MNRRWLRTVALLGWLGATAAATACAPTITETVVESEPPPAPVEVVPLAPYPGAVWIDGHWRWNGARYLWVPGHFERGRPGWVWVRHRWARRGRLWYHAPGHWQRY